MLTAAKKILAQQHTIQRMQSTNCPQRTYATNITQRQRMAALRTVHPSPFWTHGIKRCEIQFTCINVTTHKESIKEILKVVRGFSKSDWSSASFISGNLWFWRGSSDIRFGTVDMAWMMTDYGAICSLHDYFLPIPRQNITWKKFKWWWHIVQLCISMNQNLVTWGHCGWFRVTCCTRIQFSLQLLLPVMITQILIR